MKNKQADGLTVGVKYSISTGLEIDDCSDYDVTYVVYKMIGVGAEGADEEGWILIYDSTLNSGERVTEGYTDCISQNGEITPLAKDVTGEYVYKIVYTVVDDWGNVGVHYEKDDDDENVGEPESFVAMMLEVKAAQVVNTKDPIDAWKIVLYVVAGLAAVGIVVLLLIKPKQPVATVDERIAAKNENESKQNKEENNEENK